MDYILHLILFALVFWGGYVLLQKKINYFLELGIVRIYLVFCKVSPAYFDDFNENFF